MTEVQLPKRKNLARRPRLNGDWPIKVYVYDCWPQEKPPQELWDTAHEMRRLWNEFTAIFRGVLAKDAKDEAGKPSLSKEERRAVWSALDVKQLREAAKAHGDKLDSYCREAVVVDFTRTVGQWRKNPARYGPPRFQRASEMDSIRIPLNFNAGVSPEAVTNGKAATVGVEYALPFKNEAPEMYSKNGHFGVGITRRRLDLHVAYGGRSGKTKRFLPERCRIKQISLCGRRDSAFNWSWSLQFRLEHPPLPARAATDRVCGWDSGGWRLIDDEHGKRIRIGVISDNAGHLYEIAVPWKIAALSARRRREKAHCEKNGWEYDKPESWDDLEALDARYGRDVEACKMAVREIYKREKERWPERARKMMSGIVRMRDAGLKAIRAALERDYSESEAIDLIYRWEGQSKLLNETIRAFEIHAANVKRDAYRQIAAWMEAFDVIAWEGDLNLEAMSREAGKKKKSRKEAHEETGEWSERTPEDRQLEASQRYRQIVGQYQLRQFVAEKHGARLQNGKAAYSTQTCPECGGHIEAGGKLLLVCENGHKRDQDVAASLYFLNRIEGRASIAAPPVEIPAHLRHYLRVMDASETGLEITE